MKPTWSQMEALEPAECLHLLSSARFGTSARVRVSARRCCP